MGQSTTRRLYNYLQDSYRMGAPVGARILRRVCYTTLTLRLVKNRRPSHLMVDCMLSLYEMLSATVSMSAWGGHLNGLHKLFQHLGNGALFTAQSMVLNFPLNELTSIQASFWWFAISDAEQSCKHTIWC